MPPNLYGYMDETNYNGYETDKRLENYSEEGDAIRESIKNSQRFCQRFFYGTDKKKCNIARFRSKHIGDLLKNYDVVMSEDTYSTIVYETLWAEGTWGHGHRSILGTSSVLSLHG